MTALVVTIILFSVHLAASLRCFSNFCPNQATACIQLCQRGVNSCHAARQTHPDGHRVLELSCTNTTCDSTECNFAPINNLETLTYCCCTGDLCNRINGVTDTVDPTLEISTQSPLVPVPNRPSDTLICEKYNCTGNASVCYHGYEVCSETTYAAGTNSDDHACFASYHANPRTLKLELALKGCVYTRQPGQQCNSTSECHVDNPLIAEINQPYYCCCGESLCNQNDTFTHPTEVANYGLDECTNLNCSHSCVITNNTARCLCPLGYAVANQSICVDINECSINNGNCQDVCVNTVGSFRCECSPGRIYNPFTEQCQGDDGITCYRRSCTDNNVSNCEPSSFEHCATSPTTPDDLVNRRDLHYCQSTYALIDGEYVPRLQGCLVGSHDCGPVNSCELETSLVNPLGHYILFCCCYGDLCNINQLIFPNISSIIGSNSATSSGNLLSTALSLSSSQSRTVSPTNNATVIDTRNIIYSSIFGGVFALGILLCIVLVTCLACVHYSFKRKIRQEVDVIQRSSPSPLFSNELHFFRSIGRGRFAEVHHAKLGSENIAIKIFSNTIPARESWNQEKEIYETEMLSHDNILRFIKHDHRAHEGRDTFWLIFDYHQHGSLYDYLQNHRVSLEEFCSLVASAAHGLAHLHSEIFVNGIKRKPAIAHRDLKSKNVLVKSDMTCCISDLGLAIRFDDDREHHTSEAKGQVGTSRYMAPEVLEGAISFNQDSFLRIDVYAFGLILWEVASCCNVSNANPSTPDYHPPFDGVVSSNPSIDEMKKVVAEKRKRPEIPHIFQNCSVIVDTITESWDPDAEARPSAHLIETRLEEFQQNFFLPGESLVNISSKESGFLSLGTHPSLGPPPPRSDSLTFNTPLPPTPTPSYSPSVTMSPTELKSRGPNFNSLGLGSCPPLNQYPSSSQPCSPQRRSLVVGDNRNSNSPSHRSNRPTDLVHPSSCSPVRENCYLMLDADKLTAFTSFPVADNDNLRTGNDAKYETSL